MKHKIIDDIIVSNIAYSCNIGAEWLEKLSLGEKENPAVVRAVAAGLRDATKNIDVRYAEIISDIKITMMNITNSLKNRYEII